MQGVRDFLERNGLFVLIFFIFFLWKFVLPVVVFEFRLMTGLVV